MIASWCTKQHNYTNLWIDSHYCVAVDVFGIPRAFQEKTLIRHQEVWLKQIRINILSLQWNPINLITKRPQKSGCINRVAIWLAQVVEHQTVVQEVKGSSSGGRAPDCCAGGQEFELSWQSTRLLCRRLRVQAPDQTNSQGLKVPMKRKIFRHNFNI